MFLSLMGAGLGASLLQAQSSPAPTAREFARQPLPEPFNGWEARFVEVTYPPGTASPQHQHPGFVLGYVVEGEFRFAINNQDPRTLPAGTPFYEPPGAVHTTSATSGQNRTKILAIIVAPVGAA